MSATIERFRHFFLADSWPTSKDAIELAATLEVLTVRNGRVAWAQGRQLDHVRPKPYGLTAHMSRGCTGYLIRAQVAQFREPSPEETLYHQLLNLHDLRTLSIEQSDGAHRLGGGQARGGGSEHAPIPDGRLDAALHQRR
jgi:hypothetical protein